MSRRPSKIADIVITILVSFNPETTGHIGIFALVYPFKFLGKVASVNICIGIQSRIIKKNNIPTISISPMTAVLPANAGNPPAIPPITIDHLVLRFRNKEYIITSKNIPMKIMVMVNMLMKYAMNTPERESIIPEYKINEGEMTPAGIGLL